MTSGGGDGPLGKASARGPGKKNKNTAQLEAARVPEAQGAALLAHYRRYFGEPSHIVIGERISTGVKIQIYLFPPTEGRPFITAATVGMSALPLQTYPICEECAAKKHEHEHEHRLELPHVSAIKLGFWRPNLPLPTSHDDLHRSGAPSW